eukprot:3656630-Rhodomonas_salina.1
MPRLLRLNLCPAHGISCTAHVIRFTTHVIIVQRTLSQRERERGTQRGVGVGGVSEKEANKET